MEWELLSLVREMREFRYYGKSRRFVEHSETNGLYSLSEMAMGSQIEMDVNSKFPLTRFLVSGRY